MVMSGVSGIGNFAGRIFKLGNESLRRSDFDQLNLFQSMNCVSKEYEIKMKMYLYKNVMYLLLLGGPD